MAAKLTGMLPRFIEVAPSLVGSASSSVSRAKSTKKRTGPGGAVVGVSAFAAEIPQPRRSDSPMRVDLASLRHERRRVCGEGLNCLSRVPLYRGRRSGRGQGKAAPIWLARG
jgi:hypothetical protein